MKKPDESAVVERKIYGDWFDEQMAARASRDKAEVTAAILAVRHYAVRGYVSKDQYGEFWSYTMRRDGRVGKSWVSVEEKNILVTA